MKSAMVMGWAVSALLFPTHEASQAARVIDDQPSCARCGVSIERVTTLRTDMGDGTLIGDPRDVRRDSRGRYYVVDYRDPTHVLVFNNDGDHVRNLGRKGEGPGEFTTLRQVLPFSPADSLLTIEAHRLSVFDSAGTFVRSFPVQAGPRYDAAMTRKGQVVVAGAIPTRDRIGLPLHLMSMDGTSLASFGSDGAFRPDYMGFGEAVLSVGEDGIIASVQSHQYVIDLWQSDTSHRGRFVRRTTWFPAPRPGAALLSPSSPRPPKVSDVETMGSRLLVLVSVAHPDWARLLPAPQTYRGSPVYSIRSGMGLFQTRVELLDLERAELLSVKTFDHELFGFVDKDLIYGVRETPQGSTLVDIWRVRVPDPLNPDGG